LNSTRQWEKSLMGPDSPAKRQTIHSGTFHISLTASGKN
jgi:hypothetical protein